MPVGAVLVCGDVVIEAKNAKEARADPTAHAEMLAIAEASRAQGAWRLVDSTLYVSKEPCVMCAGAIVAARISGSSTERATRKAAPTAPFDVFGRRRLTTGCR